VHPDSAEEGVQTLLEGVEVEANDAVHRALIASGEVPHDRDTLRGGETEDRPVAKAHLLRGECAAEGIFYMRVRPGLVEEDVSIRKVCVKPAAKAVDPGIPTFRVVRG
jgi:hypothetical protein